MNASDLLTVPELATATGLTNRQVGYWTATGAIEATRNRGGAGNWRRYHRNLVEPLRIVAAFHRTVGEG